MFDEDTVLSEDEEEEIVGGSGEQPGLAGRNRQDAQGVSDDIRVWDMHKHKFEFWDRLRDA